MSGVGELIAAIRQRPGMYVGNDHDDQRVNRLVCWVIHDSVESDCNRIDVRIGADNSITIADDGRDNVARMDEPDNFADSLQSHGSRTSPHRKVSRCTPWTGWRGGGMFVTGGGIVANALSANFRFEVRDQGRTFTQEYAKGSPLTEIAEHSGAIGRGTSITFRPDQDVFGRSKFSFEQFESKLRDLAMVHRGLHTTLYDERDHRKASCTLPDGIASDVTRMNATAFAFSELISFSVPRRNVDGVDVDIAMQWTDSESETIICFANSWRNRQGGTHAQAFLIALTATAKRFGLLVSDLRRGLTAVISLQCTDPMYSNMDHDELRTPELQVAVATVVNEHLGQYFERHPELTARLASRHEP
jgi:DNA gyrase subunit B